MPPRMPEIGEVLDGKYRLVAKIGKGGMGAIYEAEHEAIGKRVAIKVLRPDLAVDAEAVGRFEQEPRAAAATGHRSIIDVYDIGLTSDGCRYLVMELLEGQSLSQLLDKKGRLGVTRSAYVVAQVLSALDAAHDKGIVHRDLKPDNVFLLKGGQALPDIKLLDFGTSIIVAGTHGGERITASGAVVGTPYYMAPEQISGVKDLDRRVDIYGMGVILYECLTGRVPFTASNVYSIVSAIMNDPFTPPRELRPQIPEALEAVILRAMSREREERFGDAAEMIEALLPFLDERAVDRVDLPEGLAAGAGLLDGGDTLPTSTALGPPKDPAAAQSAEVQPVAAPARPRGGTTALGVLAALIFAAGAALIAFGLFGRSDGGAAAGPTLEGGGPGADAAVAPISHRAIDGAAPPQTPGDEEEAGPGPADADADAGADAGASRPTSPPRAPPPQGGRRPHPAGGPGKEGGSPSGPTEPAPPPAGGEGPGVPVVPFDTRFE